MRFSLKIFDYSIELSFSGYLDTAEKWRDYTAPFRNGVREEPPKRVDLILELDLEKGWNNPDVREGISIEYADGWSVGARVSRPAASGTIKRVGERLKGVMKVSGDYPESIDFAIGTGLSMLCEERGDILLHSSAVLMDEGAWLFLGDGGAGKTTIAVELNGGGVPMSVDRTLVTARFDEQLRAWGTPFGDSDGFVERGLDAPVAGLVFIAQADRHELSSMGEWETLQGLLRQSISASRDRGSVDRLMKTAGILAEAGLSCRMKFRRDDGFWDLLRS